MIIYGCTAGCGTTFSNAFDWRWHEDTRCSWPESWLCDYALPDNSLCMGFFLSWDDYVDHYHDIHGLNMHLDTEAHRLSPQFETNFWCGFCNRVVTLDKKRAIPGQTAWAWSERHRHIQNHYEGIRGPVFVYSEWAHIRSRVLSNPKHYEG